MICGIVVVTSTRRHLHISQSKTQNHKCTAPNNSSFLQNQSHNNPPTGDTLLKSPHDFSLVNWGPDEAKGDDRLLQYFVPFPDFSSVRKGNLRYVVGRKGAGKTAVIERVRLELADDPLFFHSSLSLRNFPLQDFRDLRDKSFRDKSQFVAAWQFLIYLELARMICEDQGAQPRETVDELRKFLSDNDLLDSIGFTESLSVLRKSEQKLKVSIRWLAGESSSGAQTQTQTTLHYKKVFDLLERRIRTISTSSQYWVFMDELDEGYRAGDEGLRLVLLALLRAVEDCSIALRKTGLCFRPLLVLRSDIFDRLEDNDLNKLDDHILHLRWNSRADLNDNSLRKVVAARITASIPEIAGDGWPKITDDKNINQLPKGVDSLWGYLVNRTYERPRDVVKFLKFCQKQSPTGILTFAATKEAEATYSEWLYKEIRDEIHSHLPVWREAMQCITRAGTGKIGYANFKGLIESDASIANWLSEPGNSADKIIAKLFEFGIIGNLDSSSRWLFKYKDHDLTWNPEMDLIVHWGLHRKLRLLR